MKKSLKNAQNYVVSTIDTQKGDKYILCFNVKIAFADIGLPDLVTLCAVREWEYKCIRVPEKDQESGIFLLETVL